VEEKMPGVLMSYWGEKYAEEKLEKEDGKEVSGNQYTEKAE